MGYDLHITRAEDWSQNEGREITWDEWLALVEDDPELTLDPLNGDEHALWSGPSEDSEPWLRWDEGNISTKSPDRALTDKMIQIAERIGARVQGDDGEFYPEAFKRSETRRKLPWWRRLLGL